MRVSGIKMLVMTVSSVMVGSVRHTGIYVIYYKTL